MKSKKLAQLLAKKRKKQDTPKPRSNVFMSRDIEVPEPDQVVVDPTTDSILMNTSASRLWINTRRNVNFGTEL
jgi:hypothetical protein